MAEVRARPGVVNEKEANPACPNCQSMNCHLNLIFAALKSLTRVKASPGTYLSNSSKVCITEFLAPVGSTPLFVVSIA